MALLSCSAALLLCARASAQAGPGTPGADALGFGAETQSEGDAANSGSGDDLGFGDVPSAASPRGSLAPAPSPFHVHASLEVQSALRLSRPEPSRLAKLRQVLIAGLELKQPIGAGAMLRGRLGLRTEADFGYLTNRSAYDQETLDIYAYQWLPAESYLALSSGSFELSAGAQIVNFGQGEMLSVLDVVNPRDLREPLIADVGQLRLPVLMTRASVTLEPLRIEAVVVHEPYFGLSPPPLGEFSPMRRLLLESPGLGPALQDRTLRNRHIPDRDLSEFGASQPYLKLSLALPSIDLSLLAGSPLDALGVPSLPPPAAFADPVIDLPRVHPRYAMLGHAGALTLGAFMLRWEAVFDVRRPLTVQRTDTALPQWQAARSHALRALLGLTYVHGTSTSAAIEVTQSYLLDNPARSPERHLTPLFPEEAPQLALRASHSFLAERASASALFLLIGVDPLNAWVARAEVGYALFDDLRASLGFITYRPSPRFGYFYGLTHHERVFIQLRWDVLN